MNDGYTIQVPEDIEHKQAYLRGLRDGSEYFAMVAQQTMQAYDEELIPEQDTCSECGDELVYDPNTGKELCMNTHE